MKKRKFKPCPHCRCGKVVENRAVGGWFVECTACHWCGPTKRFRRSARKAWNRQQMLVYMGKRAYTYGA